MPCYNPIFTRVRNRPDGSGKKDLFFEPNDARIFYEDNRHPVVGDYRLSTIDYTRLYKLYKGTDLWSPQPMALRCRKCIGCGFSRASQLAVRAYHESRMSEDIGNAFVTCTFSDEGIAEIAPDWSLDKSHHQNFLKAVRYYFPDNRFRYVVAGEYGSKEFTFRPHYHYLLMGINIHDKKFLCRERGSDLYTSDLMQKAWPYGRVRIGQVNINTAAYVARYCMKKMLCSNDKEYYTRIDLETGEVIDLLPEYSHWSTKPGLGKPWFDKFGLTDVYPQDKVRIGTSVYGVPQYYDKLLERIDVDMLEAVKAKRQEYRNDTLKDSIYSRLLVREELQYKKYDSLIRPLQNKDYDDL